MNERLKALFLEILERELPLAKGRLADAAVYAAEKAEKLLLMANDPQLVMATKEAADAIVLHGAQEFVATADQADGITRTKVTGALHDGLRAAILLLAP